VETGSLVLEILNLECLLNIKIKMLLRQLNSLVRSSGEKAGLDI
jgi:hypothetical protein